MHIMMDGNNFIICLGHKTDKISPFFFFNEYIQVL